MVAQTKWGETDPSVTVLIHAELTCIWSTEQHFGIAILLAWPVQIQHRKKCAIPEQEREWKQDGTGWVSGRQAPNPRDLMALGWLKAPRMQRSECWERRSCRSILPETTALNAMRGNSSEDPAIVTKWKMLKCSSGWLVGLPCRTPDSHKEISCCPRKTWARLVRGFMLKREGKERSNCQSWSYTNSD